MSEKLPLSLTPEDVQMLEALVKSAAFPVLRKLLDSYRAQCLDVLLSVKDAHSIYEARGRILGLKVIENLPQMIVQQHLEKKKTQELFKKRPPNS